eukprot:m.260945 g.260945  ORF g.260945 m.260945 type:complete len:378 (-) comp40912_c0_seq1:137-1270(-)
MAKWIVEPFCLDAPATSIADVPRRTRSSHRQLKEPQSIPTRNAHRRQSQPNSPDKRKLQVEDADGASKKAKIHQTEMSVRVAPKPDLSKFVRSTATTTCSVTPVTPIFLSQNNKAATKSKSTKPSSSTTTKSQSTKSQSLLQFSTGHNALLPEVKLGHTLILGTHPSIESLARAQYYGHKCNAFWWIAGAKLGFTRAEHTPPSNIAPHLPKEHNTNKLRYTEQCQKLTDNGFIVWDVLDKCERKGSLDSNIEKESMVPTDLKGLLALYPHCRRVCFTSGGGHGTAGLFLKHHRAWVKSDPRFRLHVGERTKKVFGKSVKPNSGRDFKADAIELCVLPSVSPAFANPAQGGSFQNKLSVWTSDCFDPGLAAFKLLSKK